MVDEFTVYSDHFWPLYFTRDVDVEGDILIDSIQILDPCPCGAHSDCAGGGGCACDPGFASPAGDGKNCVPEQCVPNPCHNGGTCGPAGQCTCPGPWVGPTCETNACAGACPANASCTVRDARPVCQCDEGYTGPDCHEVDSQPPDVMGTGVVVVPGRCQTTYFGHCEVTCDRGYYGTPTAVCGHDGGWTVARCTPKDCQQFYFAHVVTAGPCDFTYGGHCPVACAPGYLGSPVILCEPSGAWTMQGSCSPVQCGPPPDSELAQRNAVRDGPCETMFDGRCPVRCAAGWMQPNVPRRPTATCLDSGDWATGGICVECPGGAGNPCSGHGVCKEEGCTCGYGYSGADCSSHATCTEVDVYIVSRPDSSRGVAEWSIGTPEETTSVEYQTAGQQHQRQCLLPWTHRFSASAESVQEVSIYSSGKLLLHAVHPITVHPFTVSDPSCADGMRNGDEEGVDCGGSCMDCSCAEQEIDLESRIIATKTQIASKEQCQAECQDNAWCYFWTHVSSDAACYLKEYGVRRQPRRGHVSGPQYCAIADAIQVLDATYGQRCGRGNDVTPQLSAECNGHVTCAWFVDGPALGGVSCDGVSIDVKYRCGTYNEARTLSIPAAHGKTVHLDCACQEVELTISLPSRPGAFGWYIPEATPARGEPPESYSSSSSGTRITKRDCLLPGAYTFRVLITAPGSLPGSLGWTVDLTQAGVPLGGMPIDDLAGRHLIQFPFRVMHASPCEVTQVANSDRKVPGSIIGFPGSSVTVNCDEGYTPAYGFTPWKTWMTNVDWGELRCQPDRRFTYVACVGKPCKATQVANSDKSDPGSINETTGQIVTVKCDEGYTSSNSTVMCQADGTFTSMICTPNPCQPTGHRDSDYPVWNSITGSTGDVVPVTCNGDPQQVHNFICQANGRFTWWDCSDAVRNRCRKPVKRCTTDECVSRWYFDSASGQCHRFDTAWSTWEEDERTENNFRYNSGCSNVCCSNVCAPRCTNVPVANSDAWGKEFSAGFLEKVTVTCDPGYTGGGDVTCQANSHFTHVTCKPKPCKPTQVPHSDKSGQGFITGTFGQKVQVICDAGYRGSSTVECQINGLFTSMTCAAESCESTQVANSDKSEEGSIKGTTGEWVRVNCNPGYRASFIRHPAAFREDNSYDDHYGFAVCQPNGRFNPVVCLPRKCTEAQVDNSDKSEPNSIRGTTGQKIPVYCDKGYTGSGYVTCQANGKFTSLTCTLASCFPTQVAHSDKSAHGSITGTIGQQVTVTCDPGYSGSGEVICKANEFFTFYYFSYLKCVAQPCMPTQVANSDKRVPGSIRGTTGQHIMVQCDSGYSGSGHVVCQAEGMFTSLQCTECSGWSCSCQGISNVHAVSYAQKSWGFAPADARAWWVAHKCTTVPQNPCQSTGIPHSNRPSWIWGGRGVSVTVTCDPGYSGSGYVTCQKDGTFTPLTCTANSCTPTSVAHSDKAQSGPIQGTTGMQIPVQCDVGYSGSGYVTCQKDGTFTPLTCTANSCTHTSVAHSDKAQSGSIQGTTGMQIPVQCDVGYSGNGDVICQTDGTFTPLTCVASGVRILSASYGKSCGCNTYDDLTSPAAKKCNGKIACHWSINVVELGVSDAPVGHCTKDLEISYTCATEILARHAVVKDASSKTAFLDCTRAILPDQHGCPSIKDKAQCCKHVDGRMLEGVWGGYPCYPVESGSGNTCEAESVYWVTKGSCGSEDKFDECAANPCQNGGVCTNGMMGYSCVCPSTGTTVYQGNNCEFAVCGAPQAQPGVRYDDCEMHSGGVCSPRCTPGYEGSPTAKCGIDGK